MVEKSLYYALTSFVFGSLILVIFYRTGHISVAIFGLLYTLVAILANGSIFVQILNKMISKQADKKKCLVAILILIINIPIAYLYISIAMNLIMNNVALD